MPQDSETIILGCQEDMKYDEILEHEMTGTRLVDVSLKPLKVMEDKSCDCENMRKQSSKVSLPTRITAQLTWTSIPLRISLEAETGGPKTANLEIFMFGVSFEVSQNKFYAALDVHIRILFSVVDFKFPC